MGTIEVFERGACWFMHSSRDGIIETPFFSHEYGAFTSPLGMSGDEVVRRLQELNPDMLVTLRGSR